LAPLAAPALPEKKKKKKKVFGVVIRRQEKGVISVGVKNLF